jgi:hypothetical protein
MLFTNGSTQVDPGLEYTDYAGAFEGRMFLVMVDAHSKWLEVLPTTGCTAKIMVNKLRTVFATQGLPDTIVSDNGTSFTGAEFQEFVTQNRIKTNCSLE